MLGSTAAAFGQAINSTGRKGNPLPQGYVARERISMLPLFRGVKGAVGKAIFEYLMERARFSDGIGSPYGANVHFMLKRGQMWTRTRQIEKDIGISKSSVARWLRILETEGLIRTETRKPTRGNHGDGFTIVTILRHLCFPEWVDPGQVDESPSRDDGGVSPTADGGLSLPRDEKKPIDLKNLDSSSFRQGEGGRETDPPLPPTPPEPSPPARRPGENRYSYMLRVHNLSYWHCSNCGKNWTTKPNSVNACGKCGAPGAGFLRAFSSSDPPTTTQQASNEEPKPAVGLRLLGGKRE